MRKTVSGIMLTLLLTTMLTFAINVQPATADYTWTKTIFILADGSITPADAPISTVDYVTYTLTENIVNAASAIVVERDNIVLDGAGYTLQGTLATGSKGIYLGGKSNVTIKNTTIKQFFYGVYLYVSSNNAVSGNNITNNWYGVWLYYSSSNTVSGNNITNNNFGVYLHSSSSNTVSGNNITNNWYGVWLYYSSSNTVSGNVFVNGGLFVWGSYRNVVVDNTVNGKPLVYLEGVSDAVVEDAGQVILVRCNRITVENLDLSHTTVGVELCQTSSTTISRNNITNNINGVYLYYSSSNTVSGNNITNNNNFGVYLGYSSSNTVSGNNITNNGYGVWLYSSSSNTVSGNNITNNRNGVWLYYSFDNMFYHNNFVDNTRRQVYFFVGGYANVWDDGYPSGGNYWSDYTGVDLKSGPNQDQPGSDGIWDHPYIIDANNRDRYPLVNPWTPTPSPKFRIGDWVQTTSNLNVREGPGLNYTIISTMPLGTIGQILGGPVEADGFVWWDVDYAVGVRGWSAENWLELYLVDQPPTCVVKLQKDGIEISEIDVWEFFDIYVGDSTDDTGIKQVRFSSDDVQDGVPTGEWTEWYNWDISLEDWNAETKIKRWAFATPGYKEVWAEVKDDIGQTDRCYANIFSGVLEAIITSPLEITPFKDTYYVGDTLTAKFTITNRGTESVTFSILVVGGRDPTGEVVDFDEAYDITLNPSDSYDYQGSLTLPDKPGNYHFFCAYQTPDGNWNTNIDVEIDGKIIETFEEARRYRERDITVFEKTYISPTLPSVLWEKISGPWEEKTWDKWASLSQIAVHPNNPEIIYAVVKHYHHYWGYQGDKLYKLTNGGADWVPINEGLPSAFGYYGKISAIAIAPSNPDIIYLGTSTLNPYSGLSGGRVYKSTNGGLNWTSVGGPHSVVWWILKSYYAISSIVVHPTNPDIVFVGTIGGGIWRTRNGGEPWERIWDEPVHKETLLDVSTLSISSANPDIIYAAAYNFAPREAMGWSGILIPNRLIKFQDGGDTWEILHWGIFTVAPKIDDIVVDTTNAELVYVITSVGHNYRVYKSVNGGVTWNDASGTGGSDPLPDVDPMLRSIGMYGETGKSSSISMQSDCSDVIYAAGEWAWGDVYFSPNSGENWFPLGLKDKYGKELGLHIRQVVFASNTNSRFLYAAGIDGLFKIDLSQGLIETRLRSPGELRVYDSQGRVTGLVNGEIKEEIPNSAYFNNIVEILSLSDSYRYEVAGIANGSYGLMVASVIQGKSDTFTATDIPISTDAIHQCSIDWDALSLGEESVTVMVDSDGDGVFEHTFTSDSELTQWEYVIGTDNTPPQTWLNIGEPKFVVNDVTYLTSATPIELMAEDNAGGSGVASTAYRIYNAAYDSGWTTYTQPFYLTGLSDGTYHIDFNSTDIADNIEPTNTVTVILDNTGPSVEVVNPPAGWALQDGVTFIISAIDASGTSSMNISIREADGGEGIPVGFEDLQATYDATTGKWILFFDTLQLPDGYYVVLVRAKDNLGNIGSVTVPYSIRNWAVIELLPASETNKAGRTMPVKFSLRVAASVDPTQPFVYNEELVIKIYSTDDPSNILQTSTFGDTARDYRINTVSEHYITNFQTLRTPKTYVVDIYRKGMLIGTFQFNTVK